MDAKLQRSLLQDRKELMKMKSHYSDEEADEVVFRRLDEELEEVVFRKPDQEAETVVFKDELDDSKFGGKEEGGYDFEPLEEAKADIKQDKKTLVVILDNPLRPTWKTKTEFIIELSEKHDFDKLELYFEWHPEEHYIGTRKDIENMKKYYELYEQGKRLTGEKCND